MKPKITPLTLKDIRYNDWGRLSLVLAQMVKELQEYVKYLEQKRCECWKCGGKIQ